MNITQFCKEVGISRPSFYKYIREGMPEGDVAGAKTWVANRQTIDSRGGSKPSGQLLSLKEDLLRANLRKVESEATLRELEAEISQRNLVSLDEAKAYIAEILGPLRVLLDSLPKAVAPQANPSDPVLAEEAIRAGLDQVFRQMEEGSRNG